MQLYKCPIHNGPIKSFSDQIWNRCSLQFWELVINIYGFSLKKSRISTAEFNTLKPEVTCTKNKVSMVPLWIGHCHLSIKSHFKLRFQSSWEQTQIYKAHFTSFLKLWKTAKNSQNLVKSLEELWMLKSGPKNNDEIMLEELMTFFTSLRTFDIFLISHEPSVIHWKL